MKHAPRPSLRRPDARRLAAFLAAQASSGFTYSEVGATRGVLPPGFQHDRTCVRLGEGPLAYERARAALRAWQGFPAWARAEPVALEPGRDVVLVVNAFSLWWLNASRIVYVVDDDGPVRRFGFAYGTLGAHVECGEERFLVEWRNDGSVCYEITAFSRPRHPLVRLAAPLARRLQRRFARASCAALQARVLEARGVAWA